MALRKKVGKHRFLEKTLKAQVNNLKFVAGKKVMGSMEFSPHVSEYFPAVSSEHLIQDYWKGEDAGNSPWPLVCCWGAASFQGALYYQLHLECPLVYENAG